jgi:hypothetical protein
MGFPYFGSILLKVINSNISIVMNINGTEVYNPGCTESGTVIAVNSSVIEYHIGYTPSYPFTIINKTFAIENGIHFVSSYSLTYTLELVPILEIGPYYVLGNKILISHTFKYPFSNLGPSE